MYYDLTLSNMETEASKISSKIIKAHMTEEPLNVSRIFMDSKYKVSFYNKKKKLIVGDSEKDLNLDKKISAKNDESILVDRSAQGHLGVEYIVLKENTLKKELSKLKNNILLSFFAAYSFIALIGYYLAKLFLHPIYRERKRLNNFIKDTTHELNTPITAILMCTSSPNGVNERNFKRINLSAKRVSEIYRDLTYLFLKDKNQDNRKKEFLRLDEVLKEQLEYFIELAHKKRIEIETDIKECTYNIDKESFIRLINNLISNAIKYNNLGGKIYITLDKNSLMVKDTGIGIEESKQKDIFSRFYRANDVQGGFGIGLNIVKEICNSYNIKIEVFSKENLGTTFKLIF